MLRCFSPSSCGPSGPRLDGGGTGWGGRRHRDTHLNLFDPLPRLAASFLEQPLYKVIEAHGFATVYSAVYRPSEGAVDYVWPGRAWPQSFERFTEGRYTHRYTPAPAPITAS